jgi:hypothetical protein
MPDGLAPAARIRQVFLAILEAVLVCDQAINAVLQQTLFVGEVEVHESLWMSVPHKGDHLPRSGKVGAWGKPRTGPDDPCATLIHRSCPPCVRGRKDIWRPHSAEPPGSIEAALPPPAWSRQTRCCCFQSSTKQIYAAQASAAAIVVWATTIPRW